MLPLSILNVLLNVLLAWVPPLVWDTKLPLTSHFSKMHPIGVGKSGSYWTLLDSGLMLLASEPATESGFQQYSNAVDSSQQPKKDQQSCTDRVEAGTEVLANKGILWAYWREGDTAVVVVTTHTAAPWCSEQVKCAQAKQLENTIISLKERFEEQTSAFELYATGDFNQTGDSEYLIRMTDSTGLVRVSELISTHHSDASLDHVFRYVKGEETADQVTGTVMVHPTPMTSGIPLSDHYLVCYDATQR